MQKITILAQAVDGIHPCVAILGSHICKAVIEKVKKQITACPTLSVLKTKETN
jgi:hypothetical protein